MDFAWVSSVVFASVPPSVPPLVVAAVSFAFGAWVGPYLGGYSRTKGENLAMHEDIRKLTDKVTAVTTATEQIKTEISHVAWNRQKRWEVKKEVLFDAAKRCAEVDEALGAAYNPDQWGRAIVEFEEAILMVRITCGKETWGALDQFKNTAKNIVLNLKDAKNIDITAQRELALPREAAQNAIRKELGIEENERRTVLSTQDEFVQKLRETHDAMLENLAHLPELAESYEVYKVGDDSTPVWRLGDLVSYFAPIQDTRLYSRYPVFRDDGHGENVAYWTRLDALTPKQRREIADTMRRSASALCSLSVNLDIHAHLLSPELGSETAK